MILCFFGSRNVRFGGNRLDLVIAVAFVLVGYSIDDCFYRVNSAVEDKASVCLWFEPIDLGPDGRTIDNRDEE